MENLQQPAKAELPNNGASVNEQTPKLYSEDEYKNLQAFGTKAQQEKIELAKKLAQTNPKEIRNFDRELQSKIISSLYGYDSIEELEIMLPSIFNEGEEKENNDDDLRQQVKLLQYQSTKRLVEDEIGKQVSSNTILQGIDGIKEKINEELKSISSDLSVEERVKKAIAIVSANNNIIAEAYISLQGKKIMQSNEYGENKEKSNKSLPQEQIRKALGI